MNHPRQATPLPRFAIANRVGALLCFGVVVGVILLRANLIVVVALTVLLTILNAWVCNPKRPWWPSDSAAFLADRERMRPEATRDLVLSLGLYVAIGVIYVLRNVEA